MQSTHTGECPYTKSIHTIYTDYTHVPILGTTSISYRKKSFDCTFIDDCPYQDDCPIFQNAPDSLTE